MDKEIQNLQLEMASFTAKVTEWMSSTKEYRLELCKKVDIMDKKIDLLPQTMPCKENDIRLRNCENKISNIQGKASVFGALGGITTWLVTKFFSGK